MFRPIFLLFVCPSISILVLTMDTLTVFNSNGGGGGGGSKYFSGEQIFHTFSEK